MVDFSHLQKLAVRKDHTVEYIFYPLEDEPSLTVVSASESNKGYTGAILKRSRRTVRRMRGGNMTPGMLAEARNEDRELYPKMIIKGWKGIKDSGGGDVAFSPENLGEFIAALPDWIFDDLREFCGNPSNFLDEDNLIETEEIAKN